MQIICKTYQSVTWSSTSSQYYSEGGRHCAI